MTSEIDMIKSVRKAILKKVHEASMTCLDRVDGHEMGEAIDMIKDLAETEEEMAKACYYWHVVKSMKSENDDESEEYDKEVGHMTPDEQIDHIQMDIETVMSSAAPEQRRRLKEHLSKWSTALTV